MSDDKKAVKKIDPDSAEWQRLANKLAREHCPIHPCRECGHPVIKNFCCGTCGSRLP